MSVFSRVLAGSVVTLLMSSMQVAAGCGTHEVVRGETLRSIAISYFGTDVSTYEIFEMNSNVIGYDPDLIEIGQLLELPCAPEPDEMAIDEMGIVTGLEMPDDSSRSPSPLVVETSHESPQTADAHDPSGAPLRMDVPSLDMAMAMADEMTQETAQVSMVEDAVFSQPPEDGVVHLLTGGPFPPFVDIALDQGGLMPHLVEAAYNKAPDHQEYDIAYVNDRSAHLSTIMPRGGFDLVFPWPYPDCSRIELDASALNICQNYLASDAIYEMVTEYYSRADSRFSGSLVASDLFGASICRPTGMPIVDLEALGLLPNKVTLVRGASPSDCLRRLDEGMIDVASMDSSIARTLIQSIGITQPLVVLERFTRVETLHVLAPKSDPMAQEKLSRFNQGLLRISESGEWFEIVNRHITAN